MNVEHKIRLIHMRYLLAECCHRAKNLRASQERIDARLAAYRLFELQAMASKYTQPHLVRMTPYPPHIRVTYTRTWRMNAAPKGRLP